MDTDSRFQAAIAAFDAANAEDPNREGTAGTEQPRELLYAFRMSRRLEALAPDASVALRLAARCQHLRRWSIPRDRYPMDRRGYLQWRNALKRFHAEQAGAILREAGYEDALVSRVGALLRKEGLGRDPEAQCLEDTACLVFLEHYFSAFARRHPEEKLVEILRKTWKKMSPAGRAAALELELPPEERALVEKALAAEPGAEGA